jgi:hypothetical protein
MASTKKLVARRTSISLPGIFGPLPLIAGEDSAHFDELVARLFAAVRPKNVLEEMIVRDVGYHDWEMSRLRRMKSGLFATGLQPSLVAKLISAPKMTESKARDLAQRFVAGDPSAVKEVDKVLSSMGLTMDAITAHTMTVRLHDFAAIERLNASHEARRHAALRELDRHRAALAGARRREEEIVDGDCAEVAPDEGVEPHQADDRDNDRGDHRAAADDDWQLDDDCVVQGRVQGR